jgi:hypothetical protein
MTTLLGVVGSGRVVAVCGRWLLVVGSPLSTNILSKPQTDDDPLAIPMMTTGDDARSPRPRRHFKESREHIPQANRVMTWNAGGMQGVCLSVSLSLCLSSHRSKVPIGYSAICHRPTANRQPPTANREQFVKCQMSSDKPIEGWLYWCHWARVEGEKARRAEVGRWRMKV